MKRPHSAYSRERELQRLIFRTSFLNFDAFLHILFGISLTVIVVMDKLIKSKFLRDSYRLNERCLCPALLFLLLQIPLLF